MPLCDNVLNHDFEDDFFLLTPTIFSLKNSELRTQTIVYSTLKLQMISKVDILVNHKKYLGLGRHLLRQTKLSLAQMPSYGI